MIFKWCSIRSKYNWSSNEITIRYDGISIWTSKSSCSMECPAILELQAGNDKVSPIFDVGLAPWVCPECEEEINSMGVWCNTIPTYNCTHVSTYILDACIHVSIDRFMFRVMILLCRVPDQVKGLGGIASTPHSICQLSSASKNLQTLQVLDFDLCQKPAYLGFNMLWSSSRILKMFSIM